MQLLVTVILTLWVSWARGQAKPCDFPEIKHGRLYWEGSIGPYFPASVGQSFPYSCDKNYVRHSTFFWGSITCTPEGWFPKVPCRRKCVFNASEHEQFPFKVKTYLQGDTMKVDCRPGYSLPNPQSTVTCTENGWSSPPRCINHCDMPIFENARAVITRKTIST
uniref:Complement factor H related 2 n=1 Tax=Myotis myotis TaxID=51298 RepID=A0A7J7RU94_MYOMY|nr:complement factor H related 2 [Myotis myotis]